MAELRAWTPAVVLAAGVVMVQTVGRQQPMPLPRPLTDIPLEIEGYRGREFEISREEQRVAGMSSYVSRAYGADSVPAFWLYVGYYESQTQGKTIHSPKNCLPGAGWEPLESGEIRLETENGPVPVNRYVIANKNQRALVYYWYQGRGRVSANEYKVKWELLRDATIRRRTDEALVRVIIPVTTSEEEAEELMKQVARRMVPEVGKILPS